ncbi:hypothetical protein ACQV19_23325, partial [Pantoea allii]|uniref:hypothetical protein n=1 Tax=Pantoea allii TaxID=574096 RepID=UPI003D31C953
VLSAHPEILHPLSGTGRPAQLPRFDNCVKTNSCIASDVRKYRFRCQKISLQMPEKHHSLLLFIFSFSSGFPVF